MARRCPKLSRHAAVLGLGVLVALGSARSVRAQYTPDPYNGVGDYNIGYRDYLISTYPHGFGVSPNQDVLRGRSGVTRANQFQSYLEGLEGLDQAPAEHDIPSTRGVGPGAPYYRAYRQYDQVFNRIYTPNELADRTYLRDRQARDRKYFEYLRETDPKKRAQLYREYTQENLRATRDLAQPRGGGARTATAPGTTAPPPSPSTRAATSPATVAPTIPRPGVPPPGSSANSPSMVRPSPSAVFPGRSPGTTPPPARRLTPSEALRRSEPLDRENRATVPLIPPDR